MSRALLLTLILLGGCSKKTAPVPPEIVFQAELAESAVAMNSDGQLSVSYSYPTCLVTGSERKKISVQYDSLQKSNEPGALRVVGGAFFSLVGFVVKLFL